MKVRLMNAFSAMMIIGSLMLAAAAPYDEPDLEGPSALVASFTQGSFSISLVLYLTLALVWGVLTLWQHRVATLEGKR